MLLELTTEGETIAEALANVEAALIAIPEAYEDLGRPLPPVLQPVAIDPRNQLWIETAIVARDTTRVARELCAMGR